VEPEHPWNSAKVDFEQRIMPKLNKYGRHIGAFASRGDEKAKRIVRLYKLLHRSFDPVTLTQLDETLQAWVAENTL
jgi:hypothetical protein